MTDPRLPEDDDRDPARRMPRDLNAPYAQRQQGARIEHDQWMKDHPNFNSQAMLENWTRLRQTWGLRPKTGRFSPRPVGEGPGVRIP